MGTGPQSGPKYSFGAFEVDANSGELRKHGIRIRLSGQPFQILLALLAKPGDTVSREELQSTLWQDQTFVDFEHSLNAAVNKLRSALGDSADSPRFVETLPGRGYRWVYPLSPLPGRIDPQEPVVTEASRPHSWAWIALLAIVGALGAGWWIGTRSRPAAEESLLRFEVPIPPGEVVEPAVGRRGMAVSPDGKRIAFTTLGSDGLYTLWVRDLSGLDARPVPAGRGAHTLFWGPDQSALYFSVRGALKKWTSGDAPVQVVQSFPGLLMSGAQLSDGRLLLSGRFESFVVDQAAGRMEKLENSVFFQPQSIPGSDEVLFAEYDANKALWRTRLGKPGSAESTELVEAVSHAEYAAGHLLYVLNGSLVARPFDLAARRTTGDPQVLAPKVFNAQTTGAADFSASDDTLVYRPFVPDSAMTWVDRAGKLLGRLGPAPAGLRHVRLSADGRKAATVLYEVDRGEGDAWVFDVRTGEGRRATGRPGLAEGVVFSPDASSIAYARAIGQPPRLWIRPLQEGASEETLPEGFFQIPTDWSRDGRYLAFTNTAFRGIENEREGNVWLIDMIQGRRVIPILDSPFHETGLVFSPDGKWVAYLTNDSGRPEAYLHRFEGGERPRLVGERRLLSRGGALQIRWSGTGREVFYLGMDNRVHAVRVSLDEARPVVAPPEDLFEISLGARAAAYGDSLFDVSPDGQRFLIPSVLQGTQPAFVVVRNWRRLLRD